MMLFGRLKSRQRTGKAYSGKMESFRYAFIGAIGIEYLEAG